LTDERRKRVRALEKLLQQNRAELAGVDERVTRVQNAESQFTAGVETDFLAFSDRALNITETVDTALDAREFALAAELRRGMAREMKEVQQYLLFTRIAIARATDQLAVVTTVEGD
jgi:hypothetical protein